MPRLRACVLARVTSSAFGGGALPTSSTSSWLTPQIQPAVRWKNLRVFSPASWAPAGMLKLSPAFSALFGPTPR